MKLNIEWTRVEDASPSQPGRFYFVTNVNKDGIVQEFCMAYKVLKEWRLNKYVTVPFEVTHVSYIGGIDHKILPSAYAIDDMVEILVPIYNYEKYSIGQIVGKYDESHTWAVRMKDRFVILMAAKRFRHYSSRGV